MLRTLRFPLALAMALLLNGMLFLLLRAMITGEGEVATLVNDVGSLTQTVANLEGQETVAAEMVEQREEDTEQAAAALETALTNVRGHWGTFGISC